MATVYRRCCGVDVHKDSITVTVLPPRDKPHLEIKQRVFRTFARDLRQMRTWLGNCRVTDVAMESTGQYWRAVWNVLEGHVPHLLLLNPLHVKALQGEKTDPIDSRRIATLLEMHSLRGSFVPNQEIRELRELMRQRVHLLEEINRVKNRAEQVCQCGNIKLSSVASDIFGVSGRRMLRALIEGNRDPAWMADYASSRLRSKRAQLRLALEGTLSEHQRSLLATHLRHVEWLEAVVKEVEQEVERRMLSYQDTIQRLQTVPGIDRIAAWTIVAEVGPDASAFPDAHHLASWAGLCPGNRESGGKRLSGRTRHGNRYLIRVLCQAACASTRARQTSLAAFYRRIRFRKGHQKAIVALAHQLLVIAYCLLSQGGVYKELGADYYERQHRPAVARRLAERLLRLGYYVDLRDAESTAPTPHLSPPQPIEDPGPPRD